MPLGELSEQIVKLVTVIPGGRLKQLKIGQPIQCGRYVVVRRVDQARCRVGIKRGLRAHC
jgi:hypothetical protein